MADEIKKFILEAALPHWLRISRLKYRKQALDDMRLLKPASVKKEAIAEANTLLICPIPAETSGLTDFLSHYRRIGVDHMLFIDRSGSDDIVALLSSQEDCSVWQALCGFKESEYDKRYFHALMQSHCLGKWTLCVDFDELFIYPYMETRCLQELTGQLDDCDRTTLWAFRLEVYGPGPLLKTEHSSHELRYFDPAGYYQTYGDLGQMELRGGPGMRLAISHALAEIPDSNCLTPIALSKLKNDFPDLYYKILDSGRLDRATTLHKIPLLKPTDTLFYQFRNRNVLDEKLNWPHKWHPCPTGVLIAPKYHKLYAENLLSGKNVASTIPSSSDMDSILVEQLKNDPEFSFMKDWSMRFDTSETLIDCGLMSDGGALRPASRMADGI